MSYELAIEKVPVKIHKIHDNVYSKLIKLVKISKCQVYQADLDFESAMVQDDIIIFNKKIFLPESIEYESFNSFNNYLANFEVFLKSIFFHEYGHRIYLENHDLKVRTDIKDCDIFSDSISEAFAFAFEEHINGFRTLSANIVDFYEKDYNQDPILLTYYYDIFKKELKIDGVLNNLSDVVLKNINKVKPKALERNMYNDIVDMII